MLVLTRRPNQTIRIGSRVTVHVLEGNRIGIEAPDDVPVLRGEIETSTCGQCGELVSQGRRCRWCEANADLQAERSRLGADR